MARRDAPKLVLAALAIAAGVLASLLPNQWIEQEIGMQPDGGLSRNRRRAEPGERPKPG